MLKRKILPTAIVIVVSIIAANILYLVSDKINVLEKFSVALTDIDFTDIYYQYDNAIVSKDTNIVIVNISIIPRQDIGRLIKKISKLKPKVIGADIFFDVNNDTLNPSGTDTLVHQIQDVHNLVLVSAYRGTDKFGRDSIETQSPRIRKYAKEGLANFNVPKDDPVFGTVRSFSPYVRINGEDYLSFPFMIASYVDPTLTEFATHDDMFIKWYGYSYNDDYHPSKRNVFKSYEWSDVMTDNINPSDFKNKIVVVGFLGERIGSPFMNDLFYSPMNQKIVGRSTPDLNGPEIHANAIKMIIDKEFVTQSWIIDFLYSLTTMILFTMSLNWFRNKFPQYYAVGSKVFLILVINAFVFTDVWIFYLTNGKLKILIGEAVVILLIIPDMLDYLSGNIFKRFKLAGVKPAGQLIG